MPTARRPCFSIDGKEVVAFYVAGNALDGTARGDNLWLLGLDRTLAPSARPRPPARPDMTATRRGRAEHYLYLCTIAGHAGRTDEGCPEGHPISRTSCGRIAERLAQRAFALSG